MLSRWAGPVLLAATVLPLASTSCRPASPKRSLTILLADDILTLDPNEQAESVTDSVLFNAFEPLVSFDENLEVRTTLAESWEHPRPEQWRFHLRRNVRFHDGTLLTAALVRDALVTVKENPQLEMSHFADQMQSAVAVDDTTLDVVTREPRAILRSLATIYVFKKNAAGAFPPLVGTGPFRLREWSKGRRIVLERWADYWGKAPSFEHVTFEPVPDPRRRVDRLVQGDADIAYAVPPAMALESHPGVKFDRRSGLTVFYLGFDLRNRPDNPFHDLRVRQAVHLAVNREGIVAEALLGTGAVANQPVAPFVFGYDPDLPPAAYDPARAKRLLAEAGHAAGFKTRLDFPNSRSRPAALVRQALLAVGIDTELNAVTPDRFFDLAKSGQSRFFFPGWDCSSGEAGEFFEFCLHTPGTQYGLGNYGGYSNPVVDDIAERNPALLDPRERKKLLQRATGIVMSELPIVPLYSTDDIYGMRQEVSFTPRADREVKLLDVRAVRR